MSSSSKSLLLVLQRCVGIRHATTGIRSVFPDRFRPIQRLAWTSTTRAMCLQRPSQRPVVAASRYTFCTKTGGSCDEYPPLPAYQHETEEERKEVFIVQVKGLLWSCTPQDLLKFFSDCRIRDGVKGIHFTLNKMGRPTGIAFIEMEDEEDVNKALEKHRQYLGPRYVEVYEVTESDAEAIMEKATGSQADDGVVRLRGLPFSSTKADIAQFFSDLDIVENGITIITDHAGRNSGEAFVQFFSKEEAEKALLRDRAVMGTRYIEVFPSRSEEVYSSKRMRNSGVSDTGHSVRNRRTTSQSLVQNSLPLHYIHMRGLPFQVSGEDVVNFFRPLVVSKMLMEFGPDGRPSGEADVYFGRHEDAVAAMSRDREHIGGRYIELFLNSVPDS
ncbi:G-rich sequence factor 1 [Takifugu rubripes]|uniref:G-rich RNA sequence binding factor 1 n=1 Tax=Takifugu rubripes TaxID=31033 RepID=H2UQL8_TAKRU|nr:G-rich sequence factor 1 [Takifugu rubripes]|eukprot:XP_011614236.1 PREDICTED: G-rich sequence factor 1 isoform X1 [Takifugu rubripes]